MTLGFRLQQLYWNLSGRLEVEWNFRCSCGELWALVVTRTDHHYADMLTLQMFYWSCNKMIFFNYQTEKMSYQSKSMCGIALLTTILAIFDEF